MTSNSDSTMHLSPPLPATSAVIRTRSRRTLRALGDEVQLHLTGADTDGQYSMFTVITAPGGGPPPHVHDNEDEWFHVIEGKVGFLSGGAWTEVGPGGSAYLSRGVAHTFKNLGDAPSRMLVHTAPAGFEDFFAELADACAGAEAPDMEQVVAVSARHGIHYVQ